MVFAKWTIIVLLTCHSFILGLKWIPVVTPHPKTSWALHISKSGYWKCTLVKTKRLTFDWIWNIKWEYFIIGYYNLRCPHFKLSTWSKSQLLRLPVQLHANCVSQEATGSCYPHDKTEIESQASVLPWPSSDFCRYLISEPVAKGLSLSLFLCCVCVCVCFIFFQIK